MAWNKNPQEKFVFWLYSMAGTGKSTIARTVVRRLDKDSCLNVNFFFSWGQGDCGYAVKFFTFIARSLAQSIPALRKYINKATTKNNCITHQELRNLSFIDHL